jgi:hypothetical protein
MRFKVVVQSISPAGVPGEAADLSASMELSEAQRQLARLIAGKGERATADGWICQARDGTRYIISLEPCQPEPMPAQAMSVARYFHQPHAA